MQMRIPLMEQTKSNKQENKDEKNSSSPKKMQIKIAIKKSDNGSNIHNKKPCIENNLNDTSKDMFKSILENENMSNSTIDEDHILKMNSNCNINGISIDHNSRNEHKESQDLNQIASNEYRELCNTKEETNISLNSVMKANDKTCSIKSITSLPENLPNANGSIIRNDISCNLKVSKDMDTVSLLFNQNSIKSINSYIQDAIQSFNESVKDNLIKIFQNFVVDEAQPDEMLAFLKILQNLVQTSYFHFIKFPLRSILLKILNINCKVSKELKLLSFELLSYNFDPFETFNALISLYNVIDVFRVARSQFRNYCLFKCLSQIIAGELEQFNSKEKPLKKVILNLNNTLHCIQSLENCVPFVEYLIRNTESTVARYSILLICYDFLKNINVDLLSMKIQNIPKDLNDNLVSKIFLNFSELKNSFDKKVQMPQLHECNSQADQEKINKMQNSSLTESKDIHSCNLNIEGDMKDDKSFQITSLLSENSSKHTNLDTEDFIQCFDLLIQRLFDFPSTKTIILSIYKRLFFYFLHQRKRIFQSIKIYKIFSKDEIRFIYKQIKNSEASFINIFKQLGQHYLLKEVQRTDDINFSLISSINQEKLNENQLRLFYSLCFSLVEKRKEIFHIKVYNSTLFCEQLSQKLDNSCLRYFSVEFNSPINLQSVATLEYLYLYTQFDSSGKFEKMVSIVTLVSLIVDEPNSLFAKNKVEFHVLILKILFNVVKFLNVPLVKRLVPVLRKLILFDEYVLYAGRLYFAIYQTFKMIDPIFTGDVLFSSMRSTEVVSKELNAEFSSFDSSLPIKAAINNNSFESSFKKAWTLIVESKKAILNKPLTTVPIIPETESQKPSNLNLTEYDKTITEKTTEDPSHAFNEAEHTFLIFSSLSSISANFLSKSLIFYLYYNPAFSFEYTPILLSILSKRDKNTLFLLEYLKFHVDKCVSFISEAIDDLYDLYFYFEQNINEIIFPFQKSITQLLFESLKAKAILPCMAIPYVLPQNNCYFIYRNHLDSCINCVNDSLDLICRNIRRVIKKISGYQDSNKIEDSMRSSNEQNINENQLDSKLENDFESINKSTAHKEGISLITNHEFDNESEINSTVEQMKPNNTKVISKDTLNSLFSTQIPNNFFHTLSLRTSLKKILLKLDYQNDILIVYVILKQLQSFNKKEKQMIISHVLENCFDEGALNLVDKAKQFYEKNPKGDLPVDFIN